LELTAAELQARAENSLNRRVREAKFPLLKPMETFDLSSVNVNLNMYQLWQSKNVPLLATYDCNKICAGIESPPS